MLVQGQLVDQENVNALLFVASSDAVANTATVSSTGDVNEIGNGVTALSDASAEADVDSKVNQNNSNSGTGSGTLILQGQIVEQDNVNLELVFADFGGDVWRRCG